MKKRTRFWILLAFLLGVSLAWAIGSVAWPEVSPAAPPPELVRDLEQHLKFRLAEKVKKEALLEEMITDRDRQLTEYGAELTRWIRTAERAKGSTRWVEVPVPTPVSPEERADDPCPVPDQQLPVTHLQLRASADAQRVDVTGESSPRWRLFAKADARWESAGQQFEVTSGWLDADQELTVEASTPPRPPRWWRAWGVGLASTGSEHGPMVGFAWGGKKWHATAQAGVLVDVNFTAIYDGDIADTDNEVFGAINLWRKF